MLDISYRDHCNLYRVLDRVLGIDPATTINDRNRRLQFVLNEREPSL